MSMEALVAEFKAKKKELKHLEQKLADLETVEFTGMNKQLYSLLEDCSTAAINSMKENFNQICELNSAVEEAISAQSEYAAAQTQNAVSLKRNILSQISDLQADINYLSPLVSGTLSQSVEPTTDVPASEEEEKQSALLPESSGSADSAFMDVVLSSESISKRHEENASSSATQSSWKVGGWFFSAAYSSSTSSSSHHQASAEDTSKIEIGFRVMKVSINRGQWFTPNVFKMTQNFYHLSESKCAPGINKDDIRNAISKTDADAQLKKLLSYTIDNKKCSYLLPSYPTAFVIAKDITIRVQVSYDEMEENKEYAQSQSSTSGGLFGFSASSASSSKNCSESSYVGARNNFIYIRIPGPQILGWFQQLVPTDASEKYEPMKEVPYNDVLKLLNKSTDSITSIAPSPDTETPEE